MSDIVWSNLKRKFRISIFYNVVFYRAEWGISNKKSDLLSQIGFLNVIILR